MWGYKANFLHAVVFPFFSDDQNTGFLYDITFIFDRRHHSWAAETPDKYERDWKYLAYTFAESQFRESEKITIRASITPCPVQFQHHIDVTNVTAPQSTDDVILWPTGEKISYMRITNPLPKSAQRARLKI